MTKDYGHWPTSRSTWKQAVDTGGWLFLYFSLVFACGMVAGNPDRFLAALYAPQSQTASDTRLDDPACLRRPRKINPYCDGELI